MMDGILNKLEPGDPLNLNLFEADDAILKTLDVLPKDLAEAKDIASKSEFIKKYLNERILESFLK